MATATALSVAPSARSGREKRLSGRLRVIQGGRDAQVLSAADHEGLHAEMVAARAERAVLAAKLRGHIRTAMRYLAAGYAAATGTTLVEMLRLVEQDAARAASMSAPCACGIAGPGHGDADDAEAVA